MPSVPELRLGTRGSRLALWQANAVAAQIAKTGGPACRIVVIKTSGDRLQDAPLSEIGGKRLFVKEIEDALLRDEIDLAVHSSKDMPAILPEGLAIGGVLPREDPRDAVVLPSAVGYQLSALGSQPSALSPQPLSVGPQPLTLARLEDLVAAIGAAPSIGTGSVRRVAQLMQVFPRARFAQIRGNLDTRLRKVDAGEYDALVLAAAGLRRLGFASRISFALPVDVCVPAPGQGIVAIEIRTGDDQGEDEVRRVVARIDDRRAGAALAAERALVDALGGGCQTPIGALASPAGTAGPGDPDNNDAIELVAVVVALDGSRLVRAAGTGPGQDAKAIGARVAAQLIAQGAGDILADAQRAQDSDAHDKARGIQR